MTGHRFPLMPSSVSLSGFAEGLCVSLGWTFNSLAGSLQLGLSLHFLHSQSLKVSPGERLSPSQVFPGLVHSPAHVCGLLHPQKYFKVFQSPLWTLCSSNFPLKIFKPVSVFCSWCHCFRQLQHEAITADGFWQTSRGYSLFAQSEFWVKSNKDYIFEWLFPVHCQTGPIVIVL